MEKSRPFKIVLITNLYPPHARGGAERVVELIAQELSNQKHEVVVITTAPKESQISNLKLKIYSIRPWNLFWYGDIDKQPLWKRVLWRLLDLYNISSARRVAKIFFKEHPDIVMTHNLVGMGYQIPQMLKRFRARHVHVIHDVQLVVPSGKLWFDQKIRWYYELYARVCRHLFGSPFVVVSPSQWLMDFYTSRGFFLHSEKIVLQNPISSTVIASGAKQSLVVAT
ncbi:glycosyltransferase, partial [Candidatus Uhrbacteria bacterium]|nr:glycosyltransferase [Candidatus Uhrbacteria bacterium]